ncbi:MAG: endonuclease MutS2 [Lachnospiraceae bacterium]|nr:endonuclease MutS2 [Lachnospiraceae bacterium]
MNKKVLETLEFNKIIERLIDKATSEPGRKVCKALEPMTEIGPIEEAQQETYDALGMLLSKGSTSFGGNKDIGYALKSLGIGSTLSVVELLDIAGLLENVDRIKRYGQNEDEHDTSVILDTVDAGNSVTRYFNELVSLKKISDEIRRCIISEDEIADDASPTLKSIRRSMMIAQDRIHTQLSSMLNGSYRTYLQDAVITQRDGRYCIPVKAEYKSSVKGMVHDQSSTGSTFFIEPEAIVNLNNEIRELQVKEKEEIAVILSILSSMCASSVDEISNNMKIMTHLDFVFAKASLALDMNATRPMLNEEKRIRIRKGRHPLLDPKKVVPIDITLGEEFDLLIITGPNTGGKTVSLKTVGLLTLMGQAGLHIPALDRSQLSIFTKVFADIGDEQSIEQSLSTFSSHMKNIVTILKYADRNSLCLFDELGAGTDPTEGAALAIAILDHLHQRRIRTMATTHYSELKVYALSTPKVENACCEFDVETLSPTYRLLIGIPGKSNAFAISQKLGLSKDIIDKASQQIDSSEASFEDLIADLESSRVTIEKDKEDIASYKAKIKELQDNLHAKNEKIDARREAILKEANAKAKEILEEAKATADETIRVFQKAGPGASMKDLEKEREKIRGEINKKNDKLAIKSEPVVNKKQIKPEELKIGDPVKIITMGMTGVVNSLPDAKGNLFVMCGALRTQTKVSNLSRIEKAPETPLIKSPAPSGGGNSVKNAKAYSISSEINLLGKTVDEALSELDKYLDDAYLCHLSTVRVVHGKGTGALRQAVQRYLRKVSYVANFRTGEYGEGDAGVTIVEFK